MLNYDYGTLQRYLAETPVPAEKYRPKHAGDFGGPETVQVHLKRLVRRRHQGFDDGRFGRI
jgi:hypothetical protein